MKAIIIGAGRGSRLGHLTEEVPKTMVPILGRPMLDQILEALAFAGFDQKDIVFVCGYRAEVVKAAYPGLTYVMNEDWADNNILLSLLKAREHLEGGFVSTYADIVYTQEIARDVARSEADIALGCDTDWRRRYIGRSQHPETDAEKLTAQDDRIVRLSRNIPSDEASGEFIGVMRLTALGTTRFREAFDQVERAFTGHIFREGRTFEKAYLIDLLAWMLERGEIMHRVNTHGGYMEIDTIEDRSLAESWWAGRR